MDVKFETLFHIEGIEKSLLRFIPGIKMVMQEEFYRGYNEYVRRVDAANVTEELNNKFTTMYPDYFNKNQDKEWYELDEYNQFMAEGYEEHVVNAMNKEPVSQFLDFAVDSYDVSFYGILKAKRPGHKFKIRFSLEPV